MLYETMNDNMVRFSKNRLDANKESDFNILVNSKYSFKLSYDEKMFGVSWNGLPNGAFD